MKIPSFTLLVGSTLRIGDESGLDDGNDWKQVHRFLSCDTILIDFTHYVRGEITENVNEKNGTRYIDVILTRAENLELSECYW